MIHHLALQNVMHFVESPLRRGFWCSAFWSLGDVKQPALRSLTGHAERPLAVVPHEMLPRVGVAALPEAFEPSWSSAVLGRSNAVHGAITCLCAVLLKSSLPGIQRWSSGTTA